MGSSQQERARRRPRSPGALALLVVVLVVGVTAAGLRTVSAAFTAVSATAGNSVGAAAVFPPFPEQVKADGPEFYHQSGEAQASGASTSLTDARTAAPNRPGTLNGATDGPSTWWRFNGDTTFARDSSGAVNSGTLSGAATISSTGGRSGGALSLNYQAGTYLRGSSSAVDTTRSFTASAWVNLADLVNDHAAVAVEGTYNSPFALMYRKTISAWELRLTTTDDASRSLVVLRSPDGSAVAGTWTHLAVVHDQVAGTTKLYVNGVQAGSTSLWTPWAASGPLVAGRQLAEGNAVNYWKGDLDEVRTTQRALSADEIAVRYSESLRWKLDEERGTTTQDSVGVGTGTPGTGATWSNQGYQASGALAFDQSANAHVTGPAAAVATGSSFTVATWAYLDVPNGATGDGTYTLLSQAGSGTSTGFILKYGNNGSGTYTWTFLVPTGGGGTDQVVATTAGARRTWVHVAAVHDDPGDVIRLYVNGTEVATKAVTSVAAVDGAFTAGRGWFGGGWVDPWKGRLDDVRTFTGALSATQVGLLANQDPRYAARVPGALDGTDQAVSPNWAVGYGGTAGGYNPTPSTDPATFTVECWFRTTTTTGGQIIGFSNKTTELSGAKSDRMVFLSDDGTLRFVLNGTVNTQLASPAGRAYNDGTWHHVAATVTSSGTPTARLYVDGALVASDTTDVTINPYGGAGYWRWGGAQISGWSGTPTTNAFRGALDEVAVYATELTANQIARHYFSNF